MKAQAKEEKLRRQIERSKLAREKQLREEVEAEKAALEYRVGQYQEEVSTCRFFRQLLSIRYSLFDLYVTY